MREDNLNIEEKLFAQKKISENAQKAVFDVAKQYHRKITLSDIYANTNLSFSEIEAVLSDLNTKNYIKSEFNETTGIIKYIFPDSNNNLVHNSINFTEKIGVDKTLLKFKYGYTKDKPMVDLEKALLQTAQEFNGVLNISQIVEYTGLSVNEAEAVIASLAAKNLCKHNFETIEKNDFIFPEIVESLKNEALEPLKENHNKGGLKEKVLSISELVSENLVNKVDQYIVKNKVKKYRKKFRKAMNREVLIPGLGHLNDKRWSFTEFMFLSLLPMFLTAGLSYFPALFINRYQTFRYYSISEIDFHKQIKKVHKNSLIISAIVGMLYASFIGLEGIIAYYNLILSFFI